MKTIKILSTLSLLVVALLSFQSARAADEIPVTTIEGKVVLISAEEGRAVIKKIVAASMKVSAESILPAGDNTVAIQFPKAVVNGQNAWILASSGGTDLFSWVTDPSGLCMRFGFGLAEDMPETMATNLQLGSETIQVASVDKFGSIYSTDTRAVSSDDHVITRLICRVAR